MGSMQPELRERLGLGRAGAYTRAAGAEACGYGDDHSAQHCSQRLPARWTPLRPSATVSRAVCATLAAVGLNNGTMRRGSVVWCR